MLFPLIRNRHFVVEFWKCQNAVSILPHEAKALLELFCLQLIELGLRQNSSCSSFASWGKIKIYFYTGGSGLDWTDDFKKFCGQDWIGFKLSDQDWNRTEKFHSLLISNILQCCKWSGFLIVIQPDSANQNLTRIGLDFWKTQPKQIWISKLHWSLQCNVWSSFCQI